MVVMGHKVKMAICVEKLPIDPAVWIFLGRLNQTHLFVLITWL